MLTACGGDSVEELPDNVLEREALISVIVELQILESHFQRQFARIDLYRDALDSSSRPIFEAHGISKAMFEGSETAIRVTVRFEPAARFTGRDSMSNR